MKWSCNLLAAGAAALLAVPAPAGVPNPCPPDTDASGDVGGQDVVNVILAWGTDGLQTPGIDADVDDSGTVDGSDLVAVLLGWGPCPAITCPFPADFYKTDPLRQSFLDVSDTDIPSIPADFFFPGSQPFQGTIEVKGLPVDPAQVPFVDTVIARSSPIDLTAAPIGAMATVDVEIIELSLVGLQPIVVQGGPQPENWMMAVGLSDAQGQGTLTATKTHATGGTATTTFPVAPRLVFAREDDLLDVADGTLAPEDVDVRVFDFDLEGLPPLFMQWELPMPWTSVPPDDGSFFCPGETFFPGRDTSPINPPIPSLFSGNGGFFQRAIAPLAPGHLLCVYELRGVTPCRSAETQQDCPGMCPSFPGAVYTNVACSFPTPNCPFTCPRIIMDAKFCDIGCNCVGIYECVGCE